MARSTGGERRRDAEATRTVLSPVVVDEGRGLKWTEENEVVEGEETSGVLGQCEAQLWQTKEEG